MKLALTLAAASFALTMPAFGQETDVDLSGVTRLDASGRYDVVLLVGGEPSITIEGPDDDTARIRTRVRNGELILRQRRAGLFGRNRHLDARVYVTLDSVERIEVGAGLEMTAENAAGATLVLEAATGASLRIAGRCGSLSAEASMGGALRAHTLECENVDARASMGGEAYVFASSSVDASASMGGELEVYGRPARVATSATMGGDVSIR